MKLLILSLFAIQLFAQDVTLSGVVYSLSRKLPLAGARLEAGRFSTLTDSQGRYQLSGLPPGIPFTLTIQCAGFTTMEQPIDVPRSGSINRDFFLLLADLRQSVVVDDGLLSVRSNAPELSQTLSATRLNELPSNGRRINRFALLNPSVRQTIGLGGDGNDSYRLSINAGNYRHTAYLLDGAINYDWLYAVGPMQPVSVGAVDQFKLITGQYAAEFGTSTTGALAIATKSGTDSWHGEALTFLRPSGIQGQAPLASASLPHIPNQRVQYGASLGGPIRKGKTFAFLNYEGSNQRRGSFIQSPVPNFFVGSIQEHFALAKIDHRFNQNHWITWRSNASFFNGNNLNDRIAGFNQPSFGRQSRNQSVGSQLAYYKLQGATLNELRISFVGYTPDSAFPLVSTVGISRPSYAVEGNSTNSWAHVRSLDLADTFAWRKGSHQIKFGLSYLRQGVRDYSYTPLGTYTYAAGAPTPNQNPLRFAQTFGVGDFKYGQSLATGFIQDDVRLSSRLNLNIGLRYERQSITQDRNNFAPRLGIAWDPKGDSKTVVRAGSAIFYDQYYLYVYRRFYQFSPSAPTAAYTVPFGDPAFPTFPNSLTGPPAGISSGRRDIVIPASKLLNPYSAQFSLSVDRQLPFGLKLSVDAIHAHTLRQMRVNDLNRPTPFIRTAAGQVRTAAQADLTRPFTSWAGVPVRLIAQFENSTSSLYQGLNFSLAKQTKRYQFDLRYAASSSATYSMFYGDANGGVPNEWNNWGSAERGPSEFHQRHRFVSNGSVYLPAKVTLTLMALAATGLPVNPLTGTDNNGDTYSADRPVGFGRNSFRGPSQIQFDASLMKRIQVRERLNLDLRLEVFNLANRNNYINLNNVYGEGPAPRATFLQPIAGVTNTDPSRQIQFSIRLHF